MDDYTISQVLDLTRRTILESIKNLLHQKTAIKGAYSPLYSALSDYPWREGKTLRPALCISTARATGGLAQDAIISSAAIEMFHNAALIHDDLEDESLLRRGKQTMHHKVGIGRAVNIGDATHVLSLSLLLENLKCIGVAKSMLVMHEIENMARQSVEGQAMELDWIANNTLDLTDEDYFKMCTKKTCWYTFITPCRIGYLIGQPSIFEGPTDKHLSLLTEFGMLLGIAFQIQDDLLNLIGNQKQYGKELCGDILEGKRTIMLNHVIANSTTKRSQILTILRKPRINKTRKEVNFILKQMEEIGSMDYAKSLALKFAEKARTLLNEMDFLKSIEEERPEEVWQASVADKRLLFALVNYVVQRRF